MSHKLCIIAALAAFLAATAAPAQTAKPDEVLAKNADTTLTRADWDADLTRIPAANRVGFTPTPSASRRTINSLLVGKTFAARARAAGLDRTRCCSGAWSWRRTAC